MVEHKLRTAAVAARASGRMPPAPGGPVARIAGCEVFPASNAWNRNVSADPVAPNSAAFPLANYSGDALVPLTALKTYGLLLADQGSAWYVTGTSDPRWADALAQLRAHPVHGSDFELLASGPMTAC